MTIRDDRFAYQQQITSHGKTYEIYAGTEVYIVAVDEEGNEIGADSLYHLGEILAGRAKLTPADLGVENVETRMPK